MALSRQAAVLLDLDGTLVDHAGAADAAVRGWADALGVGGPGVAERWARIQDLHYARYQRREVTFQDQRRHRVRDLLGARLSDEQADELFSDYLWRYEAGWRAFDDAVPTLRRIREHGLLAVVLTNGDAEQQERKVEALALSGEIDHLVCSSELPAAKPDPRAFRAALDRAGVTAGRAMMVGDDLDLDVRGALDAGLAAVLLDRDDRHTGVSVPRVRSLTDLRLPVSDG